eukprot:3240809-Rhodomonas_salina.1
MGQLDDGLGGVVLTRVVATKLIRIYASVLEQETQQLVVNAAVGDVVKLGGVLKDVGGRLWSATKPVRKGVEPMGVQRMLVPGMRSSSGASVG